jgi:hypothetical protein
MGLSPIILPPAVGAMTALMRHHGGTRFWRITRVDGRQAFWFDRERQAQEFWYAFCDGGLDGYHRRQPIWRPDFDILPGLWLYTGHGALGSPVGAVGAVTKKEGLQAVQGQKSRTGCS